MTNKTLSLFDARTGRQGLACLVFLCLLFANASQLQAIWPQAGGGTNDDRIVRLASTPAGETYALGNFSGSAKFAGTTAVPGAETGTTLVSAGSEDLFVAKFDLAGNLQWIRPAGGSGLDRGLDLELDNAGNAYLVGYFHGSASFGSHRLNTDLDGGVDGFVAKIDSSGAWQWAARVGGNHLQEVTGVAVTAAGAVFVAGRYQGEARFWSHGSPSAFSTSFGDHTVAGGGGAPPVPEVVLYENTDFSGQSWAFSADTANVGIAANDHASSVKITPGCRAVLYDNANYGGNELTVTADTNTLVGSGLGQDKATSLKFSCPSPPLRGVTLFAETNFGGNSWFFDTDTTNIGDANDHTSSVRISAGCTATLYADANYGGAQATISSDTSSLIGTSLGQDTATSLKVSCGQGQPPVSFNGVGFDLFLARLDGGNGSFQWAGDGGNDAAGNEWATGLAVNENGDLIVIGKFLENTTIGGTSLTSGGVKKFRAVAKNGAGWQQDFAQHTSGFRSYFAVGEIKGDFLLEMTEDVTPAGSSPLLEFRNRRNLGSSNEAGGVVEYSVDQGATWKDIAEDEATGPRFVDSSDRYGTATFSPLGLGGHELYGRKVFTGENPGWPEFALVQVDLSSLVGQAVRFRWRLGSSVDQPTGKGWWIDDIAIDGQTIAEEILGNVFIAKYAGLATPTFTWVGSLGGADLIESITDVKVDSAGAVFTTYYEEFTPGLTSTNLQQHDSSGNPVWQAEISRGVTDGMFGSALVLDGSSIYVATHDNGAGSHDVYVVKYDKASNSQVWGSEKSGSTQADLAFAISFGAGNIFYGGSFRGEIGFGDRKLTSQGGSDGFVQNLELGPDGGPIQPSTESWSAGQEIPVPAGADVLTDALNCTPQIWINNQKQNDAQGKLFFWSYSGNRGRLHALQAIGGTVDIRWKTDGCNPIQTAYKSSIGKVGWPQVACSPGGAGLVPCYQLHVAKAPVEVKVANKTLAGAPISAVSEGSDAELVNDIFNATTAGWSTLAYVAGETLDVYQYAVEPVVVKTVEYTSSLVFAGTDLCTIGSEIFPPGTLHDQIGRSGYVLTELAYYDNDATEGTYKKDTRRGQIVPVNKVNLADTERERLLVVAYYRHNSQGLYWPEKAKKYDCDWPPSPAKIVIQDELGSEHLGQPVLTTLAFPEKRIYAQNSSILPGFNPNDEHALFAPSNNGSGVEALFALRSDFALEDPAARRSASEPFVLLKYRDPSTVGTAATKWLYKVYQVVATETNPFRFEYSGVAGNPVFPPYPLVLLDPCEATEIVGMGSGGVVPEPFYKDHKGGVWAKSAKRGGVKYHYPLQEAFFYDLDDDWKMDAGFLAGKCIPWLARLPLALGGDGDPVTPVHVAYDIHWPDNVPILTVGETLLTAKSGLPDILNQAKVEVVFDELQSQTMAAGIFNPQASLVRLIEPLSPRAVILPALPSAIASSVDLATGKRVISGSSNGNLRLSSELRSRITFDSLTKNLTWSGKLDEASAGEPLLLINVMTDRERRELKKLDGGSGDEENNSPKRCLDATQNCSWDQAVEALYNLTRNPRGVDISNQNCHIVLRLPGGFFIPALEAIPEEVCDVPGDGIPDRGLWIGLENGPNNTTAAAPATSQPALTAGFAQGTGYVTLAFNDADELGALPVSLNVIRVDCLRSPEGCAGAGCEILSTYQGEIDAIEPDNVFDEQLTLRHSGDFAGRADDVKFKWFWHPDEDGTPPSPLPDPANGQLNGWFEFQSPGGSKGAHAISIEGANPRTLSDNWFVVQYELPEGAGPDHRLGTNDDAPLCQPGFGLFAGSPGGTPREPRAMLAEGWIKRVIKGLGPFEARVKDFHASPTNTYASMLVQLGERYEGDIAFNPSADNLNQLGLIEAYETVLRRGIKFSIEATPPFNYGPANNALLLASSRLADFYLLLGNEAFADAQDPTVGISTDAVQYGFGSLAPTIFTFENQVGSLLEEELVLLRGRDQSQGPVAARPVYNRFFWNFTSGEGEVAYALSYDITDQDLDGFVNETDARILYPQGHGDAWGHYLTAVTSYYKLLRHPGFSWVPRPEAILVAGVPIQVDFFDERKFARAAAAKAKTGAQLVDLTYRASYVEDPDGQWQGYKDVNPARAWGLSEWARRAGQGSYFDWIVGNSILPEQDPLTCGFPGVPAQGCHKGIQRVDRDSVNELDEVATYSDEIQAQLDKADSGLNPLGLAKGVVPFDIDPARVSAGETHFEQILQRAEQSLTNTVKVWDFANQLSRMLRFNQDTVDDLTINNQAAETDFKNRLIEIFGYPFPNQIGPGATYPANYDGPDLYHYMEIDTPELMGIKLDGNLFVDPDDPAASTKSVESFKAFWGPAKSGVNWFDIDQDDPTGAFGCSSSPLNGGCKLGGTASNAFLETTNTTWKTPELGLTFVAKPGGKRRATGKIQDALYEKLQAQLDLQKAIKEYDRLYFDITNALGTLRATFNIQNEEVRIKSEEARTIIGQNAAIKGIKTALIVAKRVVQQVEAKSFSAKECIPKNMVVGLASGGDIFAGARCALEATASSFVGAMEIAEDASEVAIFALEEASNAVPLLNAIKLDVLDNRLELYNLKGDIDALVRQEPVLRVEMAARLAAVVQAEQKYHNALAEGQRTLASLITHRRNTAAAVQVYRYKDMGFRIFRNDAIQKYRAQFDLAARYAFLAASAYDYETNLLRTDGRAGQDFLTSIVRERSLGQVLNGEPVPGSRGLADALGRMKANFGVLKGQMGFNNPQIESNRFSLRRELFRVMDDGPTSDKAWREKLQEHQVANLWDIPEFRRFARPFAPESLGPQPGIVIEFPTTVTFGLNFFNYPLGPGDSFYDASTFATRIRGAGVWFDGFGELPLASTPRVYLIPAGADVLRSPSASEFKTRQWLVVDQLLPTPFPIGASSLTSPAWIPLSDSLSGSFNEVRRFSSFRAYDYQAFNSSEITSDTRLIGRSVWNTKWLLIIPGGTLLGDPADGLETFIFGPLIPGGGGERDGNGVKDILFSFKTYAYSGF